MNILVIGYGSVGQAIIPLLLERIPFDKMTVLEVGENAAIFKQRLALHKNITYIKSEIVQGNLDETLSKYVKAGDLLVNVSLNIDGIAIVEWCLQNGILYIDTSIERWRNQPDETIPSLADRTLFYAHQEIRKMAAKYPRSSTAVITHGANPGLVSHFTKQALLDLAKIKNLNVKVPTTQLGWAKLAKLIGVQVIHIAERDTQIINKPKQVGEFVNTWSCEGFWAEGRAPAELGWGTHEDPAGPSNGALQGNCAYLKQPGVSMLMKSWVPTLGQYNGNLVQHSEAVTIGQYLSCPGYSPTVHYVYCPADCAVASVNEMRGNELDMQKQKRIAKDEIIDGMDELGVLLQGLDFAYWYGSQLTIEEARKLIPGENATSVQVASSLLGAITWMLKNPSAGMLEPEDLPFQEVLEVAMPYLGPVVGVKSDWKPLDDQTSLFRKLDLDSSHPLRFDNFTVLS